MKTLKAFTFVFVTLLLVVTLSYSASALLPSLKEQPSLKTGLQISDTANEYPSIEIKDWLGLGGVKADLVLTDHTPSCGNDCMSEFQITTYSDSPLIDDVKFWKIDENGEQTLSNIRGYQFYIQTDQQEIEVPDYEYQCTDTGQVSSNGTRTQTCENVKVGTHPETTPEWIPYTIGTEMPSGTYVVKLEGQKKSEWSYDWKIETQGKIINEWSVWSGTAVDTTKLYNNLTAYYGLEEASGNATDSTGKYTTNTASVSNYQVTGKVNYAYNMTGTSSILSAGLFTGSRVFNVSNMGITSYPFSFNVWIKPKTTQPYVEPTIMFLLNSASTQEYYWIGISSNNITMYTRNNLGSEEKLFSNASISSDAWVMVTTVWTSATERQFYINGVSIFNQTGSIPFGGSLNLFGLSSGSYSGLLDEAGLWSRTLNSSEVSALYKSGAGLSYANFNQSSIVLNSPNNTYTSPTNLVTTNATATVVGGATLVNMSLYDNSTGTWGLRNTTNLIDNKNASINPTTPSTENSNTRAGASFHLFQNVTLTNVTKDNSCTADRAYLYEATDADSGTLLATQTYSGNIATFNYALDSTKTYFVLAGLNSGGTYTRTYESKSYPITNTHISIDGFVILDSGGLQTNSYRCITQLNTTIPLTTSTQTWNNTYTSSTLWGVQACDSDGACGFSENRTFSIDTQAPTISVLSPVGNIGYGKLGLNVTLNYSITDTNLASCWFEYNSTNTTIPCATNYSFLQGNSSQLSGKIWANDSVGNKNYSDVNWNYSVFENSQTYNTSTYETSTETFTLNATGMTTASLYYGGTAYPVSVVGGYATKTLDIATVSGITNNTFFWEVNSAYNTTAVNQTVNPIILTLCNATYSVPYINFTYKDENSLANIRANADLATWTYYLGSGAITKTYIYQNTTSNASSTAFCFSPSDKTLQASLSYQYSNAGYPQRYYSTSGTLTNSTTNTTLYLLATADGIYSTVIVDNSAFAPIPGANIKVYRSFSGVSTLISEGTTGSDGGATFWVNPNYDHTLVITATGYASKTVTIRPTSSTYTVQLGSSVSNVSQSQYLPGAKWYYYPSQGVLNNGTTYTFGMKLNYSEGGLLGCRVQLTDINGTELQSATGCGSYGGEVNFSYNTGNNSRVVLHLFATISTGEVQLDPIAYWVDIPTNASSWHTFKAFITNLANIDTDFGSNELRQSFTRIVIFFFLICIILAALNLYTGIEFSNNGAMPYVLYGFVWLFSIGGFFNLPYYSDTSSITNPIWQSTWLTKYAVAILGGLFIFAFTLNKWTRENS